mgnify:CR=1 FL=1
MKKIIYTLPFIFILAGCGDKTIECSSDDSVDTLKDSIKNSALEILNGYKWPGVFDAKIKKSTLNDLDFDVSDITTTKKDPNSNLRVCEAVVKLGISSTQYNKIKSDYATVWGKDLDAVINNYSLRNENGNLYADVSYSVRPTDDKETIYIKVSDNGLPEIASLISFIQITKPTLEKQQAEQQAQLKKAQEEAQRLRAEQELQQQAQLEAQRQQAQREEQQFEEEHARRLQEQQEDQRQRELQQQQQQQEQEQQEQQEQPKALNQGQELTPPLPQTETVGTAKDKFYLSDRELNSVWSSLNSATKKSLLNEQRQWLKNKDLACGKVDLQADDAATIKMFTCQNEITQKRIIELKNNI